MAKAKFDVVQWLDHASFHENEWSSIDDLKKLEPIMITSAGWIIFEDKNRVVIVAHKHGDKVACGEMSIIKSAITKRWSINDPSA